ncbi:MAG: hypothetical protein AAF939_19925 [Planctomycetota bacterium]
MLKTLNRLILFATAVACVAQFGYWFGRLPDIVPSHFDDQGNVNDEMNKIGFYLLFGGMHFVFLLLFPILGWGMGKIPDEMLNIPNKEYWLAPERRESTLAINFEFLTACGWLTSWLLLGCFQLTALVATTNRNTINPEFSYLLVGYLMLIFGGVAFLFYSFRIPSSQSWPQQVDS